MAYANIDDLLSYEERFNARRELLAWLNNGGVSGDSWRNYCMRWWLNELNGLAGVW